MARIPFNTIFQVHSNGSIEPRQTVRIGGVTMSPGVRFTQGAVFGGIDLARYVGHELEVIYDDGTAVITGIY